MKGSRNIKKLVLFFVMASPFCSLSVSVNAAEVMTSPHALEAGDWTLSFYGGATESKPTLDVSQAGAFLVPTTGGSATVFSQGSSEVELEQKYGSVTVGAAFRPKNGLTYRFNVGQLHGYEVQFASGSSTNQLEALDPGYLWGAGIAWNVTPGTIISPAVTLDLSYRQSFAKLDAFRSNGTVSPTDQRFEQQQYQLAVSIAKRFKSIEPYGGLKLFRTVSKLKSLSSKQAVRGEDDEVSPYVGLMWEIFPRESFVVEAAFVGETSLNAGFNITF